MFHTDAPTHNNWIPFTLQAGQRPRAMKLDFQAILQALITASVTAAIVMYASVRVLDERVGALQREMQEVKTSVQNIQRDVYRPVYGNDNGRR